MSSFEVFSSSPSDLPHPSPVKVQVVPKPVSDRLLEKFLDVSEFNFDYSKSGIWSPPIRRSVFLSSPGRICTEQDMLQRLRRVMDRRPRRYNICFNVWNYIFPMCVIEFFSVSLIVHAKKWNLNPVDECFQKKFMQACCCS
ncbi:hypothetical protein GQ457_07G029820 [Hibiscus cannabinus]